MNIVAIVEGDGEVLALPILLRRLASWRSPGIHVNVSTPIRVKRDRFLGRSDEFRRYLLLAAAKCGADGWILLLLDADDDCPAELGAELMRRAAICVPHRRVSVVLANREYEAWFIAAARSLRGCRGFAYDPNDRTVPEVPRDAKGWMGDRMKGGVYRETTDQPAFSAIIDLDAVFGGSRSFKKLCTEWDRRTT